MSYKPMRGYVPLRQRPGTVKGLGAYATQLRGNGHHETRQGDEMACKCGKRWPVGEEHP